MARMLTLDDVQAGVVGGLFLSAGGSGRNAVEKNQSLGRMALDYGGVRLVGIDELDPRDLVITATAVGAPGFANWAIRPRDAINAARRLVERMDRPARGLTIVADGNPATAERLKRVLDGDPGIGVLRHADAGYEAAIEHAEQVGLSATLPGSL